MSKKKIIACQVFTEELAAVLPDEHRDIDITWLDPGLHYNLDKLETTLRQTLKEVAEDGADTRVLFGHDCHPDMSLIIGNQSGKILGARNCLQAFCGDDLQELEQNRTMVITPGWIRYFHQMMSSSGWDEVDIRQNFGLYDRILLVDTGVNPMSDEEILEFYDLVQVPVEIQEIGLDHFRTRVLEVLG